LTDHAPTSENRPIAAPQPIVIGGREFVWGRRTYLMGIVNATPDSFSGDGLGYDVDAAVARAQRMAAEGADLLDVGGESTRPDAPPVPVEEELRRVIPVIKRIVQTVSVPVSIDTYKAAVAEAALSAGAVMVNDISGFRADPAMAEAVARFGVPAIVMHNQRGRIFHDVIRDIRGGLKISFALAEAAGTPRERLIIDPGFGFGWTYPQNLEMLRHLAELKRLGRPILIATSSKSTIGAVLDKPTAERIFGTAATVALGIANGGDIARVHNVAAMRDVCLVSDAIVRGNWQPE
jgi:dihydropteroate synthase